MKLVDLNTQGLSVTKLKALELLLAENKNSDALAASAMWRRRQKLPELIPHLSGNTKVAFIEADNE
jgi:hypothetical protein